MLIIKQCITYVIYLHGKAYIIHTVIAQNVRISRIQKNAKDIKGGQLIVR